MKCPFCGSRERHRLLWLYLQNKTDFFTARRRILHFAPEDCFEGVFRTMHNLTYLTTDLGARPSDVQMDITNLAFGSEAFDVVLCSHVLEHSLDDTRAMREILRILKPGGWAILMVPIDHDAASTFEDASITSAQDRERFFGQKDHVRFYGRDFKARLEQAGFHVKEEDYCRELGSDWVARCSLSYADYVYVCSKVP